MVTGCPFFCVHLLSLAANHKWYRLSINFCPSRVRVTGLEKLDTLTLNHNVIHDLGNGGFEGLNKEHIHQIQHIPASEPMYTANLLRNVVRLVFSRG